MKLHRVAKNFPRMSSEELLALRKQVKELGVIEPVYSWEDDKGTEWLIDGGNRQAIVQQLLAEGVTHADNGKKIELETKPFKGTLEEMIHFVEAKNGPGRRHLSSGQRAATAILMETDYLKQAGKPAEITNERIEELAERWNTNSVYLYGCKAMLEQAKDVLEEVRDGSINVGQGKMKLAQKKAEDIAAANGRPTSADEAEAEEGKEGKKEPAATLPPPPAPPVIILDGLKRPVVEIEFQPVFETRADFRVIRKSITDSLKSLEELVKGPGGKFLKREYDELRSQLKHCGEVVDACTPFCICLVCQGEGKIKEEGRGVEKKCEVCDGKKYVSRAFFRSTPKEYKVGVVEE